MSEIYYEPSIDAVACELGDGVAVLDLKRDIYYSLNDVGGLVWNLLKEQPNTIDGVVGSVLQAYSVDEADCRQDISQLLDALCQAGLVRSSNEQH